MVKRDKEKEVQNFSLTRQILSTYNELIAPLPYMRGLLEVDVTDARKIIKNYFEKTNNRISFTGWIIKCVSEAIKENKIIHAYRIKKGKIIIPQEIRFGIMVERKTKEGEKVPFMAVINNTEKRNVIELSDEIRKIQEEIIEEQDQMMGEQNLMRKLQLILFRIVPEFISRWLLKKIALNKKFVTKFSGTVGVTALGMYGKNVAGWAIHFPTRTVDLALGGIKEKPGYVNGKVVPRDILNMTFNIDHNIVDGAPAARFISRAVELIESAFGLEVLEK